MARLLHYFLSIMFSLTLRDSCLLALSQHLEFSSVDTNSLLQLSVTNRSDPDSVIAKWIGCFTDSKRHSFKWSPDGQFTIRGCMKECLYTRYTYMALQDQGQCWCDNKYKPDDSSLQLPDNACNSTCESEDPEHDEITMPSTIQRCGRRLVNAVYQLKAVTPSAPKATQTTTTQSTLTATSTTGTTTTVSPTTSKTTLNEATKIFSVDVCQDKAKTNFTIGGHAAPCKEVLDHCDDPEYSEMLQSDCPVSCGACPPSFIGCFRDDPSDPDMDENPPGRHDSRSCMKACANFKYMGLQNGRDCWCSMSYSKDERYHQVLDRDCGSICPEEETLAPPRYCGTFQVNAIYKMPVTAPTMSVKKHVNKTLDPTGPTQRDESHNLYGNSKTEIESWVGCFPDGVDRPFTFQLRGSYSTGTCAQACTKYKYMALHNTGTCWCGNSYETERSKQPLADTDCGDVCHGEASLLPVRYCGSNRSNAVYKITSMLTGENTTLGEAADAGQNEQSSENVQQAAESQQTEESEEDTTVDEEKQTVETQHEQSKENIPLRDRLKRFAVTENNEETKENVSDESKELLHATFNQIDTDHDGSISMPELAVLNLLNDEAWDDTHINNLVSQVDANGDHQLQFEEFEIYYTTQQSMEKK